MKYPIGYNSETRTCQFIEEFNAGASFRMWMDKGKTHIEVFTPDMKRRKEKDFAPHVKSLNEYVFKMYARFNSYKPKGISAAFYVNCFGCKYLRSVDLKYVKSIDTATLRTNQLDVVVKDDDDSLASSLLNEYLKKTKDTSPGVLDRAFNRLSKVAENLLTKDKPLRKFSFVDEIGEISTHFLEVSKNRQMLVDAIVWHYKVLNGLIEDKTVEVTQASNGRFSVILVNGEAVVIYDLYNLIEENFIMSSLVEKDKYPVILQEYKDWLVSADYDELLNQMNKTPYSNPRKDILDLMENKDAPKHLFGQASFFTKAGNLSVEDIRMGRSIEINSSFLQIPNIDEHLMNEMRNCYEESKNRGILGKRKRLKD